ncbi:MAG: hypothetical protein HYZ49_18555 [Chloroflexi bacterium]|nr:hypothetical protein [Chloroflexota bacterium]
MARSQQEICRKHGAIYEPVLINSKIGITENTKEHVYPLNGLRIRSEGDTSGWYIWAGQGEPSDDPSFFKPLHIAHLETWYPEVVPYLGLPPGWRFLLAQNYEDVWFDSKLLEPQNE